MVKNSVTLTPATETVSISVLSLMVWGSPGSFGVEDKELRMAAIGDFIAGDSDHDVFLLNDVRTKNIINLVESAQHAEYFSCG